MPTNRETVCCHDLLKCTEKFEDATSKYNKDTIYNCICQHEGFQAICLRWDVLDVAWLAYRQQYGAAAYDNRNANKRYRHIAYRQLARLLFGIVGRTNRYILPSCAVSQIRKTFPSEVNEEYTGFMYAD